MRRERAGERDSGPLDPYVSRAVLRRLASAPSEAVQAIDGTMVLVDVTGFTRLSERLARTGREGAEHLADAIGESFSAILTGAYANGGELLKFGGDALLLLFEGDDHPLRACRAATVMRRILRDRGPIEAGGTRATLRMSMGVHSGTFHEFLVGTSHRELIVAGPAASAVVAMEASARSGEIVVSADTAARLPSRCLGPSDGAGARLARSPIDRDLAPVKPAHDVPADAIAACLPVAVREHVLAGTPQPEHRTVTVAFLRFGGVDTLIEAEGGAAAADAIAELVADVQEAADRSRVTLLASDIAADGGKLILAAGAPRAVGDDEERMLLALRRIADGARRLPVSLGVNRGAVFAGEIGPHYRRTYTVMGDAVNLAARLMAAAPPGRIYATKGVLDRSTTRFTTTALAPLPVKGKLRPVEAWDVGLARRGARPGSGGRRFPLVGRDREIRAISAALDEARRGHGSLVEIVGEVGSGKSRLLTETRRLADGVPVLHAICEAYTSSTPYVLWRDLMRQLLDLGWDDPDEVVLERLRAEADERAIPLLGIVVDAESPEPERLGDELGHERLHRAVLDFLADRMRRPMLVQIEHAHHMDEASARLLTALARRLPDSSWLVLLTRRDVQDGFRLPDVEHTVLEPRPLTEEEALRLARAVARRHAIAPHVVDLAVRRAAGSPQFLLDLLAAAAQGSDAALPDSVDAAALARLDALDPSDRVLVRRAAVLGMSFHPRHLGDVLDEPPDDAAWARLRTVFAEEGEGYLRFRRPDVREVAYQGLPFRVRRELHATIAGRLERELDDAADPDLAVLSMHLLLAGDHERAHRHAMAAADYASARYAHADAARLYRRAIEAGRSSGVASEELAGAWEALAEALRLTGEPERAHEALAMARRLSPGDPVRRGRLFYRHARLAERAGQVTACVRWAQRGLRALDGTEGREASQWRARLFNAIAGVRQRQGRPADGVRLSRLAVAEAERSGDERALGRALYVLDWALVSSGRRDEATHSARALEIYARLGDVEMEAKVLNNLGMFAYFGGDWDDAVALYRRSASCSDRAGDVTMAAYGDCNVGEVLSDQGHLEEAAEHLTRALQVWRGTGDAQGVAFATMLLGRTAARGGRRGEALRLLTEARQALRGLRLQADAEQAGAFVAEAEALLGDPRRALELAGALPETALQARIRGLAHARLGEVDLACAAFETSLLAARDEGSDYDVTAALDALDRCGVLDGERRSERDALLRRLRIAGLPYPVPRGSSPFGGMDATIVMLPPSGGSSPEPDRLATQGPADGQSGSVPVYSSTTPSPL